LSEETQICYTTFKNYKASKNENDSLLYSKFLSLYKKALTIQKKSLFENLKNDDKSWQRYAWIIERKFSDWNLKHLSEVDQTTTNIDITESLSEEQKEKIANRFKK
jgi:GTP-sensing pleiotropic transcriptional regulator CodY